MGSEWERVARYLGRYSAQGRRLPCPARSRAQSQDPRPGLFHRPHSQSPTPLPAYWTSAARFSEWCRARGILELAQVETIHVSAYIEELTQTHSRPTVKQHLAALKMLFDWLVVGQVMPANPASVVRGSSYSQKKGKTPLLTLEETRKHTHRLARSGTDEGQFLMNPAKQSLVEV
jgi:hypothetical protein